MPEPVVVERSAATPTMRASAREAIRDRDVLHALVMRELSTRYRRSILGWAWSLVHPALSTVVYTFVFSVFLEVKAPVGVPSGVKSFPLYLLCGLLPWSFFVGAITTASSALTNSVGIISKVRFAREHVVLAPVVALGISLLIELSVVLIFLIFTGRNPLTYVPIALLVVALLALFTAGLALLIAPLCARYRDITHLLGLVFMAWFYLTPIAYPLDRVPDHVTALGVTVNLHTLLLLNPMARFVQAVRNCLYDLTLPGMNTFVMLCVVSVLTFLLGYRTFVRRANRLIEVL